ncbi:SGNH/GDSL hydrolase family protein [Streptomyces sp. ISL-43]|uniref:SGNH/GDSL hydrolase family protein n=1 Tax=Streptomyces sp. ISL-43 TaxID=2819183 RepID=UPI001BE77D6B|nr:SGNH/GDSL hydrolase family protein [Streptomyces sp. ISL-43]MBT2449490.1 SGNH/GDSL hydrolase family protein [Streptomyces sp. ISL-43]
MSQPTRTITGTYTNPATQLPATGRIVLSPLPRVWTDAVGGEILAGGGTVEVVAGVLSRALVTTDAPGIEPTTGRYWVYEERLDGLPYRRKVFELPLGAGSPIKISSIIDADPAQPGYTPVQGPIGPAGPTGATGSTGPQGPAGPVATAWRRRDLPDPLLADGLYTGTAPGISTAQTTTPTAGYVKYAPPGVALAGSDVTGPYNYAGASGFQIGAGAPDTSYVLPTSKYPNSYASGQSIWSVEFGTDSQFMQVRMKYISAATMFRLTIDGRKVTDLMQSSGGITPGSGHLITIDLGSAAPRRIRLDFSTFPFGGVYLPPTATMWRVPLEGGRLMVLGDSISDGSAQNVGGGAGTWVARVARFLGATDAWEQGRGGTGYITAGAYATFGTRAPADVVAWAPTRLLVSGGYNDSSGDQGAIATAAAALYTTIKASLPGCEIYVIGCWSPAATPSAGVTNTDATLRTAAAGAGIPFISPVTGACYDAAGALVATHGPWITAGNVTAYIGGDGVHPTDAGHVYLARRITAALRELMPA